MRRLLTALALVFALVCGFAALAPAPADAGLTLCYYTCGCNGQVLYCCPSASGGVSCKVATWPTPIQCPQIANC